MSYFQTEKGVAILGDSLAAMQGMESKSQNLIVTSPPYALVTKKTYGNESADKYLEWFKPFAQEMHRLLTDDGSLVINVGAAWDKGQPTKSLYQFELLLMLVKELGFYLAQDYYWWSPTRLPSPSEWVCVKRIRVKDAVEYIWWLSKTPYPKADNRKVLIPYSENHLKDKRTHRDTTTRPSGYFMAKGGVFTKENDGAIPPNLLAFANAEASSHYIKRCKEEGIPPHPARFPSVLPEYFVRFLTDEGDTVLDPFAGSLTTGAVCERLNRQWTCIDDTEKYLQGGRLRFEVENTPAKGVVYQVQHPAMSWNGPLPSEGEAGPPDIQTLFGK